MKDKTLKTYLIVSGVILVVFGIWTALLGMPERYEVVGAGLAFLLLANFVFAYKGSAIVRKCSFSVGLVLSLVFSIYAVFVIINTVGNNPNWVWKGVVHLCAALLSIASLCCVFFGSGRFKKIAFCLGIVLLLVLYISFTMTYGAELS